VINIGKINTKDELVKLLKNNHDAFLLYVSCSFKKAIGDIEDKEMVIRTKR
jgi:hypothetical protein